LKLLFKVRANRSSKTLLLIYQLMRQLMKKLLQLL